MIIAGEVLIGAREMRTMGIEAAYPIRASTLDAPTGGDLTAAEVAQAAVRGWHGAGAGDPYHTIFRPRRRRPRLRRTMLATPE